MRRLVPRTGVRVVVYDEGAPAPDSVAWRAAQRLQVLGYTSQARFLLNLGLAERMAASSLAERSQAQRLLNEHEMGELFRVQFQRSLRRQLTVLVEQGQDVFIVLVTKRAEQGGDEEATAATTTVEVHPQ